MNKLFSFELFNDFIDHQLDSSLYTIKFDLKISDSEIKYITGIFNVSKSIPFKISSSTFQDIRFNFKSNLKNLDTYTLLAGNFGVKIENIIKLIGCYYIFLYILDEYPYCYNLDVNLPHKLSHSNYFNKNAMRFIYPYAELAYYIPDIPVVFTSLAGKTLELCNEMNGRLHPGPELAFNVPYSSMFNIIKMYMTSFNIKTSQYFETSQHFEKCDKNRKEGFKVTKEPKHVKESNTVNDIPEEPSYQTITEGPSYSITDKESFDEIKESQSENQLLSILSQGIISEELSENAKTVMERLREVLLRNAPTGDSGMA